MNIKVLEQDYNTLSWYDDKGIKPSNIRMIQIGLTVMDELLTRLDVMNDKLEMMNENLIRIDKSQRH